MRGQNELVGHGGGKNVIKILNHIRRTVGKINV